MTHSFLLRTPMPVSAQELYAWHARPGAFQRLNPPFAPVEVVERTGGLEVGARTVLRMHVGPAPVRWVARHTACEPGRMFRDEQESGPFARWVHTHRFEPQPDGTSILVDEIDYALPLGALGDAVGGSFAGAALERTFQYRHALTRMDLARHAAYSATPLRVAVTGASGLLGSALLPFLSAGGHSVTAVKRRGAELDTAALAGADVVVNLAGAGIADARWTEARKRLLVESREDFTRRLVAAFQDGPPKVLIQGSAVGIYGNRGDDVLTESALPGSRHAGPAGFLAGLCADWEAAAQEAERGGTRVVLLRTGVVQTAQGGALAKVLRPFQAGAGGPLGQGRAWLSWISLEDMLGAILHLAHAEQLRGPVNAVAPHPVTGAEYARTLGRVLSRPAVLPVPGLALRALLGELADGALLASQRAHPGVLERSGFTFQHPTLEAALRFTLGRACQGASSWAIHAPEVTP